MEVLLKGGNHCLALYPVNVIMLAYRVHKRSANLGQTVETDRLIAK